MNFVTGVSHELRTPLAVMLSAAENILDGVVEEPAEIQEHGAIIAGQIRQLMDLVDRILGFVAGGNGEQHQRLQVVVVTDIVQQVLRNLAEPLRIMGMEVEQKIESALPSVLADPVVLSQCLQNLTINAMKYRGQHNWIGVSAKLVAPEDSAPEIQISVQDRGIGVRDSELHRIFEPFYRSPEVVASNIQGTGLGLSVVQRGVAEMGGRLTVTSTLGMGSTFTIHMPISELVGTPGACEPISDSVHSQ
jgi:signal transduction histidine kinase